MPCRDLPSLGVTRPPITCELYIPCRTTLRGQTPTRSVAPSTPVLVNQFLHREGPKYPRLAEICKASPSPAPPIIRSLRLRPLQYFSKPTSPPAAAEYSRIHGPFRQRPPAPDAEGSQFGTRFSKFSPQLIFLNKTTSRTQNLMKIFLDQTIRSYFLINLVDHGAVRLQELS